jgi:hypothetical protein
MAFWPETAYTFRGIYIPPRCAHFRFNLCLFRIWGFFALGVRQSVLRLRPTGATNLLGNHISMGSEFHERRKHGQRYSDSRCRGTLSSFRAGNSDFCVEGKGSALVEWRLHWNTEGLALAQRSKMHSRLGVGLDAVFGNDCGLSAGSGVRTCCESKCFPPAVYNGSSLQGGPGLTPISMAFAENFASRFSASLCLCVSDEIQDVLGRRRLLLGG